MVDMFEGVRDESISHADMEYWFRDNPEDIVQERFIDALEEIPNTDFNVRNEAWDSVRPQEMMQLAAWLACSSSFADAVDANCLIDPLPARESCSRIDLLMYKCTYVQVYRRR